MSLVDKLNYLLQTKELIKNAIIAKGVEVTAQDTFRSYVQKILSISSGTSKLIVNLIIKDRCLISNIIDNGGLIDVNQQW